LTASTQAAQAQLAASTQAAQASTKAATDAVHAALKLVQTATSSDNRSSRPVHIDDVLRTLDTSVQMINVNVQKIQETQELAVLQRQENSTAKPQQQQSTIPSQQANNTNESSGQIRSSHPLYSSFSTPCAQRRLPQQQRPQQQPPQQQQFQQQQQRTQQYQQQPQQYQQQHQQQQQKYQDTYPLYRQPQKKPPRFIPLPAPIPLPAKTFLYLTSEQRKLLEVAGFGALTPDDVEEISKYSILGLADRQCIRL